MGDWNPAEHPRWPGGAPGGRGGEFRDAIAGWATAIAERLNPASLARSLASGVIDEQDLGGGHSTATVTRVTFADGSWGVRKRYAADWAGNDPQWQADTEQLVSVLARHIGAPVPEVTRTAPDEVVIRGVEGEPGYRWLIRNYPGPHGSYDSRAHEAAVKAGEVSSSQRRLGLLYTLIDNYDSSNPANWFVTDVGETIGIDHTNIRWGAGDRGPETAPNSGAPLPFGAGYTRGFEDPKWASNPLTKADVSWLRRQIAALRPAFERAGRLQWWEQVSARFEAIAAKARGRVGEDVFAHG